MDRPLTKKEIVAEVLKRRSSTARNPANAIGVELRYGRHGIIALGNGLYATTRYLLDGAKFRVVPATRHIQEGILPLDVYFAPFNRALSPKEVPLRTQEGKALPVLIMDPSRLTKEAVSELWRQLKKEDPALAKGVKDEQAVAELFQEIKWEAQMRPAFGHLSDWFVQVGFKEGDSLIVTIDMKGRQYPIEPEPATRTNWSLIEQHDRELADAMYALVKGTGRAHVADRIVFGAYGNLPWVRRYPGSPWFDIVEQDDRLHLIMDMSVPQIAEITFRRPLDMLGVSPATQRKWKKLEQGKRRSERRDRRIF